MSCSSNRQKQSRIETLENLVLMSASAIDVDLTELPDPENLLPSPDDGQFLTELESLSGSSDEVQADPLLAEFPLPIATVEGPAAESGVDEADAGQLGESIDDAGDDIINDASEVVLLPPDPIATVEDPAAESDVAPAAESNVVEADTGQPGESAGDAGIDIINDASEVAFLPSDTIVDSDSSAEVLELETLEEVIQPVGPVGTTILAAEGNSTDDIEPLADDTTAAASSSPSSKLLVLNGEDNDAVLEDNGNPDDDLVQLRSTNGTFETIVFQLPTDVLTIEMGDGNDTLVVEGLDLGTIFANVSIFGQGGDDSIVLNSLETSNDVVVNDTQGDNSFNSTRLDIGGDLLITDGDGEQHVDIRGAVDGDVRIDSTDGGSFVQIGARQIGPAQIGGSVIVNSQGEGADTVRFDGLIDGDLEINAGNGDFDFSSIFSSVKGKMSTDVGIGNSRIFLGDFSVAEDTSFNSDEGDTHTTLTLSFLQSLTINNGLGFDELRVDSLRLNNSEAGLPPGSLTVNNGDGGSLTQFEQFGRLSSSSIDVFRLNNGDGTDTIKMTIEEETTLNSFIVDNGDGDSVINIMSSVTGTNAVKNVTLVSGEGTDTISLDGVRIESDLIIDTGDGERTVDIQNSDIGNTDINYISESDGGETTFGDGDDEIFASLGNNIIDGGAGDDAMVVYEGTSADFTITYTNDGRVIVEGPGLNGTTVRNTLTNVERILFNDKVVYLTDSNGGDASNLPTISGTDGDDWIAVSERGGKVDAGAGNDSIYAPFSQTFNQIDGGDGTDTLVIYEGVKADYTLRRQDDSSVVEIEGPGLNGSTVINHLTDVEYIQFNDGRVKISDLT